MAITDYYLLDYIQSTGTQWINTGVSASDSNTYRIKFNFQSSNEGQSLVGYTYNNSAQLICIQSGTLKFYGAPSTLTTVSLNTDYIIQTYSSSVVINDTTTVSSNNSAANNSGNKLYLLSVPPNGGTTVSKTYACLAKLYYSKIWTSSTLVRNFVAAQRKSDSVYGLYDLVNDIFYTNAGSGVFTPGTIDTVNISINIHDSGGIVTGSGIINKNPDGKARTTLLATPDEGYTFSGWYDSNNVLLSKNNSYKCEVEDDTTYIAKFNPPGLYFKKEGTWVVSNGLYIKDNATWNVANEG